MKHYKKIILIIIGIIILTLGYSNKIYATVEHKGGEVINAWPFLTQNQNGWYCLQHHLDMANGGRWRDKWSFSYTSDSGSEFEKALAYIIRDAQNSGDNGWHSGNGYHQQAIWGLIYRYRGSLPVPLNTMTVRNNNAFDNSLINTAVQFAKDGGEKYSDGTAKIETSDLTVKGNLGEITIKKLSGYVDTVDVYYKGDSQVHTIEGFGNKDGGLSFWDSKKTNNISVKNMIANTKYVLQIPEGKTIESIQFNVIHEKTGFRVYGDYYLSNGVQSLMYALYEKKEGRTSDKAEPAVKYLTGEITVKKIDYTNSSPLDDAQFAIFVKNIKDGTNEGWLGYSNGQVTYSKTWKNAAKFRTGRAYCGNTKTEGEFTLSNLKYGRYYVFEVEPANGYEKKPQYGWNNQSGQFDGDYEMVDSLGKPIERFLIGDYETFKNDYIERGENGFEELKNMTKKLWEVYNDKRKTL